MDALESIQRKIDGAKDLKSVVKSMKAMAAANIGQYEQAVASLGDYFHTVTLGFIAYLKQKKNVDIKRGGKLPHKKKEVRSIYAIVFGSDQGLVGQFNDVLSEFVWQSLNNLAGNKEVWAIGERVQLLLQDRHLKTTKLFLVPGSVSGITPLVVEILTQSEKVYNQQNTAEFYVFHNQPKPGTGYEPVMQQLLPLDEKWKQQLKPHWPTNKLPEIIGDMQTTLLALAREYLFMSLFKACAESLATENTSRLEAMQRAEKNIGELLDDLDQKFHRLRQSSIDEELFDVVSGFESLKSATARHKA